MRNIKLILEYEGINYVGWQKQPNGLSIQEVLERSLQKILQKRTEVIGAGRTDAGVHAKAQVANFKTESTLGIKNIKMALNSILPSDIAVKDIEEVPLDFHARRNARSRLYCYTVSTRDYPSPFLQHYAYFYPYPLKIERMRRGAKYLIGRYDFTSFQARGSNPRNPTRHLQEISIRKKGAEIFFYVRANAFLYHMVRNIVGTLLEVGRGKLSPGEVKDILEAKDRTRAGPTVPAHGLCLMEVSYNCLSK